MKLTKIAKALILKALADKDYIYDTSISNIVEITDDIVKTLEELSVTELVSSPSQSNPKTT